jgi:hypothetical protein
VSYSCTDFTDDILDALNIVVPEEDYDNPSAQADRALAEIRRLQETRESARLLVRRYAAQLEQGVDPLNVAQRLRVFLEGKGAQNDPRL